MFWLTRYANETVQEIKKVSWPTQQQTVQMTVLVVAVSLVIGAYIGLIDYIFQSIISKVL